MNELYKRRNLPQDAERDELTRLEKALSAAGIAHEANVIQNLKGRLHDLPDPLITIPFAHPERYELTSEAIRNRVPLIAGAALKDDLFAGYVDLLILSEVNPFISSAQRRNSHPGSYSVCEVKLASLQNVDYTIQTAAYATMLNSLLATFHIPSSPHAFLWLGDAHGAPQLLDVRTLTYLFERTKTDYCSFLSSFDYNEGIPLPDSPMPDLRPWSAYAKRILENMDSLRLVANIRRSQAAQIFNTTGVDTLAGFAQVPEQRIRKLLKDEVLTPGIAKLHQQARMQYATRTSEDGAVAWERIYSRGVAFPEASDADMYFDIEGYPLMAVGGLEYLLGLAEGGRFQGWWAHTREEEEAAFVQFINIVSDTVKRERDAGRRIPRIYHYGSYEVSAMKRVALRTVTSDGFAAAQALETLLDENIFFDVYKFIRRYMCIGEQSYSIKKVEKIVGVSRKEEDLADAESSVAMYHEWRRRFWKEDQEPGHCALHEILQEILDYNRQDCESLGKVVLWLREQFPVVEETEMSNASSLTSKEDSPAVDSSHEDAPEEPEILAGACGRNLQLKIADSEAIQRSGDLSRLLLGVQLASLGTAAKRNVSHLLHFYTRESSPARRAFRDKIDAASSPRHAELFEDEKCLNGLRYIGSGEVKTARSSKKVYHYAFSSGQPSTLVNGDNVAFVIPNLKDATNYEDDLKSSVYAFMTIKDLTRASGRGGGSLSLSTTLKEFSPPVFGSAISTDDLRICNAPLRQSLLRKAEALYAEKKSTADDLTLAQSFLSRLEINEEKGCPNWSDISSFESDFSDKMADFLATRSKPRVFVIQGPPGSGKTFLSSKIIRKLVTEHGKTIAVSSNSHAAIDNLLLGCCKAGVNGDHIFKIGTRIPDNNVVKCKPNVKDVQVTPYAIDGDDREIKSKSRAQKAALVGATCFQLCREENENKFDVLFVDEASQVTMADFVAMSACAKYAVLVGDQQQLEMPIQGAHPGAVGLSCLSYTVGEGVPMVPPSRGVFLESSYRMSPDICRFISEAFYDNALASAPICAQNEVKIADPANAKLVREGSGVLFIPSDACATDGSVQSDTLGKHHEPDEVKIISQVVEELQGSAYTTGKTKGHIRLDDILVVAPYNIQVRALREALPDGIRVGTVDKFQGQEAPIVLVSTCASQDSQNGAEGILSDGLSGKSGMNSCGEDEATLSSNARGLRFCLRKNRLNVAISRAQCLAVVTGHPSACANMKLNSPEDVGIAALYEYIQHLGRGNNSDLSEGASVAAAKNV